MIDGRELMMMTGHGAPSIVYVIPDHQCAGQPAHWSQCASTLLAHIHTSNDTNTTVLLQYQPSPLRLPTPVRCFRSHLGSRLSPRRPPRPPLLASRSYSHPLRWPHHCKPLRGPPNAPRYLAALFMLLPYLADLAAHQLPGSRSLSL